MGASLATVAGGWERCKCGLLGGQSCLGCPCGAGQAGCGGKVGLFLMGSVCGLLSSEEGREQWDTHSLTYSLIQTFYRSPLYTMAHAGYRCYTGAQS